MAIVHPQLEYYDSYTTVILWKYDAKQNRLKKILCEHWTVINE